MALVDRALDWVSGVIARYVTRTRDLSARPVHTDVARLARVLRPGDVLLIDGGNKISATIRYLTQSGWSHAAIYVGDALADRFEDYDPHMLVEVVLGEGCIASPLSKYAQFPTRICRPVNLIEEDRRALVDFMISHLGVKYDARNLIDLARYLFPYPPVFARWRRRMLALGSGEPTRAICSTLIAQAFGVIDYPILPDIEQVKSGQAGANGYTTREILHIRHHSLYVPRDFDISPYFEIVKPTLAEGFNYKGLTWAKEG